MTHQKYNSAIHTHSINEDLRHGCADLRVHRGRKVLDGEQQAKDEEPSEDGGDTNSHDNSNATGHCGVGSFLRHLIDDHLLAFETC